VVRKPWHVFGCLAGIGSKNNLPARWR